VCVCACPCTTRELFEHSCRLKASFEGGRVASQATIRIGSCKERGGRATHLRTARFAVMLRRHVVMMAMRQFLVSVVEVRRANPCLSASRKGTLRTQAARVSRTASVRVSAWRASTAFRSMDFDMHTCLHAYPMHLQKTRGGETQRVTSAPFRFWKGIGSLCRPTPEQVGERESATPGAAWIRGR